MGGFTLEHSKICSSDFNCKYLKIEGYASVFNEVDATGDIVAKGAFKDTLKEKGVGKIKMLWSHDPSKPIGVWDELKEDDFGLYCKGRVLVGKGLGLELKELLCERAIDGLSIGYRTLRANYRENKEGRILKAIDLWEISLAVFPAEAKSRFNIVDIIRGVL